LYEIPNHVASELFSAYASFLELLDDENFRQVLEKLRASDSRTDPTFKRVREMSEQFEHTLDHIFFENAHLKSLTRKYGVF